MTRTINLTVNDVTIKLDYFVAGFLDHVTGGILAGLKDTGELGKLKLSLNNEGQVTITLNGVDVPLNYFANDIVKNTFLGMIAGLKGVTGKVNNLELNIER
jgi:hypothetical protein